MKSTPNHVAFAGAAALITALAGCVTPTPIASFEEVTIGESVQGRSIMATVVTGESIYWEELAGYGVDGNGGEESDAASARPDDRETILLFAAIHGNETLTGPLLDDFVERVRAAPEIAFGKRLVIVPVANPDGLAKRRRGNANGVDINRNFPARNWKRRGRTHGVTPASEPETRVLMELVERYKPARIL